MTEALYANLAQVVGARLGLHFSHDRLHDLERGIAAAAGQFGMPDADACARWLLSAPLSREQIAVLASCLTVGETYFFREPAAFDALEQHVLPALIQARRESERRLRIWSAGCCTGEEPYSIAILLDRLLPDWEHWNVTLVATDINPLFLRKAAEGVYGDWSFRETPGWIRERYFRRRRDGRSELHPDLRRRVTFSYLNLVDDVYPSLSNNTNAMDLIFCRNVLMYFSSDRAKRVAANLHRALVDGGWLIVSPTERSNVTFAAFTAVEFPGAVVYRKGAPAITPRAAVTVPEPAFGPVPKIPHPAAPFPAQEPTVPEPEAPEPAAAPEPVDPAQCARAARTCANAGRLDEAAEWCERAIAADKLNPVLQYLLATIRQEQGRPDAATHALMRALYLDPGFVLAHFALGNLSLAQGRRRQAERHLGNALALARNHPPAEPLPESEGLTAGRLVEIIGSLLASLPRGAAAGA
jgi:chemotaxis protein methyltransferase CheR